MVMAKERPECYSCSYKMYSDLFRSKVHSPRKAGERFWVNSPSVSFYLNIQNKRPVRFFKDIDGFSCVVETPDAVLHVVPYEWLVEYEEEIDD